MLFILTFSWPVLANEPTAIVCKYKRMLTEKYGEHEASGEFTFFFNENKNTLEQNDITKKCDKTKTYIVSDSSIFIECENKFDSQSQINITITINRFSGRFKEFYEFQVNNKIKTWRDISGTCTRNTKKF